MKEAIRTYKLAAYTATLKKEKFVIIGGLYLRTARLYRLQEKNRNNTFGNLLFFFFSNRFRGRIVEALNYRMSACCIGWEN